MSLISRFMKVKTNDDLLREVQTTRDANDEDGLFMFTSFRQSLSSADESPDHTAEKDSFEALLEEVRPAQEDSLAGSLGEADASGEEDDLLSVESESSGSSEAEEAPAAVEEPKPEAGGGGDSGDGGGGDIKKTVSLSGGDDDDALSLFRTTSSSSSSESARGSLIDDLEDVAMEDLLTEMRELRQMFGNIEVEEEPEAEAEG